MTKTQIAKALREAAFSPNKQGPLQVIADVGNVDYYIRRANEFLTLSLMAITPAQKIHYLNNTLSLVALAKVKTSEKSNVVDILDLSDDPIDGATKLLREVRDAKPN